MKRKTSARLALFSLFAGAALAVGSVLSAAPAPAAETTVPNNLAVPVIWSDGASLTLNGTYGAPTWTGETATATLPDGTTTTVWLQGDPGNTWQAQTASGLGSAVNVSTVDWGDNLSSAHLSTNGQIRVETVLKETLPTGTTMNSFEMLKVGGSGTTEVWGATKTEVAATEAVLYSGNARLTI